MTFYGKLKNIPSLTEIGVDIISFLMPLKQGSRSSKLQQVSQAKSDNHGTSGFSGNPCSGKGECYACRKVPVRLCIGLRVIFHHTDMSKTIK